MGTPEHPGDSSDRRSEEYRPTSPRLRRHAWIGFATSLLVIIGIHFTQLYTMVAGGFADGIFGVGFPFTFFERGGIAYHETFCMHWLLADVVIALVISSFVAYLLRDGWRVAFRRVRTWGLDHVESSDPSGTQE